MKTDKIITDHFAHRIDTSSDWSLLAGLWEVASDQDGVSVAAHVGIDVVLAGGGELSTAQSLVGIAATSSRLFTSNLIGRANLSNLVKNFVHAFKQMSVQFGNSKRFSWKLFYCY